MTEETDDVRTLIGNPRKALLAMSVPIALSSVVAALNNVIDCIWVSGLGPGPITATGVLFPFFYTLIGLGNGIGIGASQAISRRIGAKDYEGTHRVASQAFVMVLVESLIVTAVLLLFAEPIMSIGGGGQYMEDTLDYALPIFGAAPMIMTGLVLTAFLRSEGAARRSMFMNLAGTVLNLILDPIFIYGFGWGVSGAAWATAVSMSVSACIGLYWYFIKKSTFVRIPLKNFRFDRELDWDILRVGVPATADMLLISLMALSINNIIVTVDPVDGVAIYTVGWRVVDLMLIPAMSMGNALVPICAAAYGAGRTDKLKEAFAFSSRMAIAMMLVITAATFLLAPQITFLFTYGTDTAYLFDPIASFLRICCCFMPFNGLAYCAIGVFLGLGMGTRSLMCTAVRNVARLPICAMLAPLGVLSNVWWGVAFGEVVFSLVTFAWASFTVRDVLSKTGKPVPEKSE